MRILVIGSPGQLREEGFYLRSGADGVLKKPVKPVELMIAASRATGVAPVATTRETAPGVYAAETRGGALRRLDGTQLVNLRQTMPGEQFLGLLRFFMEDAVPGILALQRVASRQDPDRARVAFSASKSRSLAGYLGLSSLSDLLGRIEDEAKRGGELASFANDIPATMDDTLEELKRVLPETFATLSSFSGKG